MQAEVRALHGPRGGDKIGMLEGKPEPSVAGVVSWGRGGGPGHPDQGGQLYSKGRRGHCRV